jgi:NAD-dependent SIR2 family protein deacetylase
MIEENIIHPDSITELADFFQRNKPIFVLTGAGCSTASGIPDYRDEQGEWKNHKPIQFQDFFDQESTRQLYWARSMHGWPLVSNAKPAGVHLSLAKLEKAGLIQCLVTQNIDGLHQKAGSSNVMDLHGNLEKVSCLNCDFRISRNILQQQLLDANPQFMSFNAESEPDGDAQIGSLDYSSFTLISCPQCNGILKPEVVFFGESVPGNRVSQAMHHLQSANAMLVIGSSLMVFSGYRFCRAANEANMHICIVNRGRTRADKDVSLKIEADCSEVLAQLLTKLGL